VAWVMRGGKGKVLNFLNILNGVGGFYAKEGNPKKN